MRRILVLSLLAGLGLLAVPARALDCPTQPAPQVVLNRIEDPVQYNLEKNRAQLNQMGSGLLAARNTVGSSSYVGGLTNGTISSIMSTELQSLTSSDGKACVWISKVNIRLRYQPVVYISREFARGTCYHNVVLEHEHRHVAVDRALLVMFGPELQAAIQQTASTQGRVGPISTSQLQAVSQDVNDAMERKLNEMMNNLSIVRKNRQGQVDTPQEYAHVQGLCQNWP